MKTKTYTLYIENDNAITISDLVDTDGASVDAALVQAVVLDADGEEVDGYDWPLTLSAQGEGTYTGVISSACVLEEDADYTIVITATQGAADALWRVPAVAKVRRSF